MVMQKNTPSLFMCDCLTGIWKKSAPWVAGTMGFILFTVSGEARAACVNGSLSAECVGTINNSTSIGTGQPVTDNDWTVIIGDGSTPTTVTQNGNTVISLYDHADITVKPNATVQGSSNSGSGGHFGSGPNVIEFNSYSTVTIAPGGTVQQLGSTNNGEAINAHGFGNTIINNGTLHSQNGAAMWFQDTSTSPSIADRNTVVNYGTISTGKGDGYSVFGSSRGGSGPGLVFNNYGTVKGSLKFGNGNDSLLFGPGSSITGNVDGGGGTNDLTLDAGTGESATLAGSVLNFSSITKIGTGSWAILGGVPASPTDPHPSSPINGSLKGVNSVIVENGSLALVGANPDFNGTVRIDAPGTLNVQAQGVNGASSMENNGKLLFLQSFDDSYTGSAITGSGQVIKGGSGSLTMSSKSDNTYSGGTIISEGALVVDRDADLGGTSGGVTLGANTSLGGMHGTLRFDAGFDMAPSRSVTLMDGGGTIDTQQYDTAITQAVTGTGALTKSGSGTLALSGVNAYAGGTILEEGTLAINADSALGNNGSRLVMYDATTLRLDGDANSVRPITLAGGPWSQMTVDTQGNSGLFSGSIDGNGKLVKTGSGLLALHGNNVYQGGTLLAEGTLAINSDAALGGMTGPLALWDNTTLRLDGDTSMPARPVTIGGGENAGEQSVTVDTQGYSGIIAQAIGQSGNGPVRLDKTGIGVLGLYGDNAYSGGTWIKNGTVAITAPSGLGTGDAQLGDHEDGSQGGTGGTLGTLRADADLDFTGSGRGILLNQGGGAINTNGFAVIMGENVLRDGRTVGASPDMGRDLHKTGEGILSLIDNQYYSGRTFIDQGILRLDAVDPKAPMTNSKGLLNTTEVVIAAGTRLEGQGVIGNSMNARLKDANAPAVDPGVFTTIINNGTIAPGFEGFHNSFDDTVPQFVPLTLAGNYKAGKGARVEIHTELLDDASRHGSLIIDGAVDPASDQGRTQVKVIHKGGDGRATDYGIEIIRLRGNGSESSRADLVRQLGDNFHLVSDFRTRKGESAVVAGAYSYVMENDIDWYEDPNNYGGLFLRNPRNSDDSLVLHPATSVYESYLLVLGGLNRLPTLEQRVGHRIWLNNVEQEGVKDDSTPDRGIHDRADARGAWMRMEGSTGRYKPKLGSGGDGTYNLHFGRLHLGFDMPVYESDNGSRLVAGINGNISKAKADIRSFYGDGDITTKGTGVGGSLTWFDRTGFYADAQAWYTWFRSDISSSTITSASRQADGNDGNGYAYSLELGRIFDLAPRWSLTPQAQLMYSRTSFDNFTDPQNSVVVTEKNYKSLEGRLGMALNYENNYLDDSGMPHRNKLYMLGNVYHEFEGDSKISISNVDYESKLSDTWLGIGIGGSHNWDDDRFSLYGETGVRSSTRKFGNEYELTAEIGLRVAF